MREYELIIDEALRKGISPVRATPFNAQVLRTCYGLRVGLAGLEHYSEKENPLDISLSYSWPFPQFITGDRYNLLIVRDSINHVDTIYSVSDDHSSVNYLTSIPKVTYGEGTLMEVADFGKFAFMTNGVIMMMYNSSFDTWDLVTSSTTIPMMRTVCNFKGQLVGGNVVSDWYDCGSSHYVWSKIGQANFVVDRYNLAGYRRDPYGGEVYHTRRLGNSVVGYSSEGIVMMSPVSDPAPTLRFDELSNVGLKNMGAMNGDFDQQVYVGEDNIVRRITEKGIEELGYESYVELLDEVIVQYDKKYKDFYIGDELTTYLLSPSGMTLIPQHPSAVWRKNKNTYMIPDTVNNYKSIIVTRPFDMGYAGQKTIFSIETDLVGVENAEVAVDYYSDQINYSSTPYRQLNDQGTTSFIVSGNAFVFRLRFDPDDMRIGYIKVRYKMTDLRTIRGVYAPPPRGQ